MITMNAPERIPAEPPHVCFKRPETTLTLIIPQNPFLSNRECEKIQRKVINGGPGLLQATERVKGWHRLFREMRRENALQVNLVSKAQRPAAFATYRHRTRARFLCVGIPNVVRLAGRAFGC
jgi:hypothetical protein